MRGVPAGTVRERALLWVPGLERQPPDSALWHSGTLALCADSIFALCLTLVCVRSGPITTWLHCSLSYKPSAQRENTTCSVLMLSVHCASFNHFINFTRPSALQPDQPTATGLGVRVVWTRGTRNAPPSPSPLLVTDTARTGNSQDLTASNMPTSLFRVGCGAVEQHGWTRGGPDHYRPRTHHKQAA